MAADKSHLLWNRHPVHRLMAVVVLETAIGRGEQIQIICCGGTRLFLPAAFRVIAVFVEIHIISKDVR